MIRLDIEKGDIDQIAKTLGANEKQVNLAVSRALKRTAGTARKRASKALREGLELRRASDLRKRLRELKLRQKSKRREISIWFGLNDLPVSAFKGRPRQVGKGVTFRNQSFPGGFVATGKSGRRTIFRRRDRGRFPIQEQTMPVKDQADVILEDEVFADLGEVFMKNLLADLRARTVYGVKSKHG